MSLPKKYQKILLNLFHKHISKFKNNLNTNIEKAEKTINDLYALNNLNKPKLIIWMDSPMQLMFAIELYTNKDKKIYELKGYELDRSVSIYTREKTFVEYLNSIRELAYLSLKKQVSKKTFVKVGEVIDINYNMQFLSSLSFKNDRFTISNVISSDFSDIYNIIRDLYKDSASTYFKKFVFIENIYIYEFYKEIYNLEDNILDPLLNISKEIDFFYPFENVCFACKRYNYLNLDENNLLHADGKKAVVFEDGFGYYYWHGIKIPEKYGKINSDNWQSKWIIDEGNSTIRRILIDGIGYDRMLIQLKARKIHTWKNYELYRITSGVDDDGFNFLEQSVDIEPIHLLKMICPSTELFYTLRVPPSICGAKQALNWVNWDINVDSFIKET